MPRLRYGPARRTMQTRPYPFDRLPKLTRSQLRASRALRSLCDPSRVRAALLEAGNLLAQPVGARPGTLAFLAGPARRARFASSPAGALIVLEGTGEQLGACVVVEVASACAERLVDRVLGGDAALLLSPTLLPLDEMSRGVLLYLVARVLAVLDCGLCLRDLSYDTESCAALLGAAPSVCCPLELRIGDDGAVVWVHAPADLPARACAPSAGLDLNALRLCLRASCGHSVLRAGDLAGLQPGDIVVLDACSLVHEHDAWTGRATLTVQGSGFHFACSARERGLTIEAVVTGKEATMTSGRSSRPEHPAAGAVLAPDAPIELSVELAHFSLSLGELASLHPGDVLTTGRRVGELVTLRAAGRALAQGELVDVEGEVGVRVTRVLQPPQP